MTTLENFAPGPLPVINAVCKERGLVEMIDDTIKWDQQQAAVSPELLTAGLIINFLTEGQPIVGCLIFSKTKIPKISLATESPMKTPAVWLGTQQNFRPIA